MFQLKWTSRSWKKINKNIIILRNEAEMAKTGVEIKSNGWNCDKFR